MGHMGRMHSNYPNKPTLASMGEFGLIEQIRAQVDADPTVPLGIGDDCAATLVAPGHILLTSKDLLIEDVHFKREWISMYQLGRKSAAVNLSDVAAMGGEAHHLFLGVGLPVDIGADPVEQFIRGFLDECNLAGATLCGGDTCRSNGALIISVTVQGSIAAAEMVQRGGAHPGDHIYVSGTVGDSALALTQLQAGVTPDQFLLRRHNQPTPRLELGRQLASRRLATAMIDISDGVFADLGHILEQSHCGAVVDCRSLPFSSVVQEYMGANGGANGADHAETVICGGEDYELLFCVDTQRTDEVAQLARQLDLPLSCIGTIREQGFGLQRIDPSGRQQTVTARGFNHFR